MGCCFSKRETITGWIEGASEAPRPLHSTELLPKKPTPATPFKTTTNNNSNTTTNTNINTTSTNSNANNNISNNTNNNINVNFNNVNQQDTTNNISGDNGTSEQTAEAEMFKGQSKLPGIISTQDNSETLYTMFGSEQDIENAEIIQAVVRAHLARKHKQKEHDNFSILRAGKISSQSRENSSSLLIPHVPAGAVKTKSQIPQLQQQQQQQQPPPIQQQQQQQQQFQQPPPTPQRRPNSLLSSSTLTGSLRGGQLLFNQPPKSQTQPPDGS